MKPFRFFIPKLKSPRTLEEQMRLVFSLHDELLDKVDDRIAWAKTRSQSESWWDLDLRSCSEHYALIDDFFWDTEIVKMQISSDLLDALWARVRRQPWDVIKSHLSRASKGVDQINQMFRPTR